MPIGFGRVEFIKRSEGRNSCQLSSYLSRSRIFFEGNCALEPKLYDFSHRESVSHHEIILPEGADENLKVPEILWNLAEKKEVRKDAQVSMHLVLALPDDKEITLEDRIELTRSFIQKHYPGLIAECVIHPPERKIEFTQENQALGIPKGTIGIVVEEKEGNYIAILPKGIKANPFVEIGTSYSGMSVQEHNWHAHAQLTTRRLNENGKDFEDYKATDLMPVVKKGKVISGPDVGRLWAEHQNTFFHSKGFALRVDDNGIIPQEHLGPVRMRARAFALLEEHTKRLEMNEIASKNPQNILDVITKRQSVFTKDDVERFMLKHVPGDQIQKVREDFWKLEGLVQLRSLETKELIATFTSEEVIEEEEHILRLADRIHDKKMKEVPESIKSQHEKHLSKEQKAAYHHILDGKGFSCIQGYAGTGKSYLLKSLKDAYEERGLIVRSFGPDNATANVLKEKGFLSAENIYRFLFSAKHGLRQPHKGFEVWILDEAGKLGNKPLLEFLKLAETKGAKVILAGDSQQLPSVERGGVFKTFCERYGSEALEDIQRQKDETARAMAKNLAKGEIGQALDKLSRGGALHWSVTRKEAIEALIEKWAIDHQDKIESKPLSKDTSLIIAGTNNEVRVLNEMVRLIRKERGEISSEEFACETAQGTIYISRGDRIEFRRNDRELGVTNGMSGTLIKADRKRFSVAIQENERKTRIVSFNPEEYHRFQLGYASTCSRAQGRTVKNSYVLHSPYLNKQMAYVGLTRHVENAHYFVSKEDAFNLADLKRKALRDGSKATTLEYTYTKEMEGLLKREKKAERIEGLKDSGYLGQRVKGKALDLWDRLNQKSYNFFEKREDRKADPDFYLLKDQEEGKGSVRALSKDVQIALVEPEEKIDRGKIMKRIKIQDQEMAKLKRHMQKEHTETALQAKEPSFKKAEERLEKNGASFKSLCKEDRNALSQYFKAASEASSLKEVAKLESVGSEKEISETSSFASWQKACGKRNEAAYYLKPLLKKEECQGFLQEKTLYYIESQASKHETLLEAQQEKSASLEEKLASHVQPLLYKLFPDGPSSKSSRGYRFGSKGSLSVTHSGPKAGQFYDFEAQEGGGMLKLIAKELHLGSQEAKEWAGEFLGLAEKIKVPEVFSKPLYSKPQKEESWFSLQPDTKTPAPKFEELGKLHHYYKEVARHPYYDKEGNLLYYVLRLENSEGKKITPPLSYGSFKEEEPSWQLKGYKDPNGKNPLYGLEKLKDHPLATVVIVEGEKAADFGAKKFLDPERHICLSWSGGVSSVSKADWSALEGRKVLIWGDHDSAGIRAQQEVCTELKKLKNIAVKAIDHDLLREREFPNKWDLADPFPERASEVAIHYIESKAKPITGDFSEIERQVEKELGIDKNFGKGFGMER